MDLNNCGINIIDISTNRWDDYTLFDGVLKHIERKEIALEIRRALETGEPLYRVNPKGLNLRPENKKNPRSVVDVPFQGGTLAVNSMEEDAFDQRVFHILDQFAQVMAEGVRRLEDFTTLAAQEEQLRQAQKMEAVGQLTAGIAHNFNNRLMAILNSFELLQMRETYDPDVVESGSSAAEGAAEIVEQLMVFSRSDQPSNMQPIQIHEIIHNVMEIGRETFNPRIALRENVSEELSPILGDANQLEQVFLNLILNARDALEAGDSPSPSIHIDVHPVLLPEEDWTPQPDLEPGAYLRIHVADNGTGMDEETQQRLFEPFYTTKEVG